MNILTGNEPMLARLLTNDADLLRIRHTARQRRG